MKLSATDWQKGISDSHYTGIANMRNVQSFDSGVLRVSKKPQLFSDLPGTILDIRKSYFDVKNDWYAVYSDDGTGNGGVFNSKDKSSLGTGEVLSGGVQFRNYFIPFPAVPGTDVGYLEDTTNDGIFDSHETIFRTLVTKGQTQNVFVPQTTPTSYARYTAIISATVYVVARISSVTIKEIGGSDIQIDTSAYTSSIRDVVAVGTNFVVVTQDTLYGYNSSGTLLDTHSFDFTTGGDSLEHLEAKELDSTGFVVMYYTVYDEDNEGLLRIARFGFDGTFTQNYTNTVWNGADGQVLAIDPHLGITGNGYVFVLYYPNVDFGQQLIAIYNENSGNLDRETTKAFDDQYVGVMEKHGTGLIAFGNTITSYWEFDGTTLELLDDTILSPNKVENIDSFGDYFSIIADSNYAVYKYNESNVSYTPSIVIRDEIYWANGNSIGAIREVTQDGFDPTDDTTYTLETDALDLPFGTQITSLSKIGLYMAIGTKSGQVYLWDTNSSSFDLGVNLGEQIASMNTKNNLLYITTQTAGNFYIANLSSYQKVRNFSSLTKYTFDSVCAGMDFFDDGAYMGVSQNNDNTLTGIWRYRNNAWTLIGTDNPVTALAKASPSVLVYSTSTGLYTIDISGSPVANWSEDGAYFVTQMEVVGTTGNKSKPVFYEILLDDHMQVNEYVKVYVRYTTNGDWTLVDTITSSELGLTGGLYGYRGQLLAEKTEQIQYKVVMNTTAGLVTFRDSNE